MTSKSGSPFVRVGECLYRYEPSGTYYALLKKNGKQIRASLETKDRDLAKRRLAEKRTEFEHVDLSNSRLTLTELVEKYWETVTHQAEKTIERKSLIKSRLEKGWPVGAPGLVTKIRRSHLESWLAQYNLGEPSFNLHLGFLRELFRLALDDRAITKSPVDGIKARKCARPIRITPSYDEFRQIVAYVRQHKFNEHSDDSADYLEMMGEAGLGKAEINGIVWKHIRFEAKELVVYRFKTKTSFTIPLYPNVSKLLEEVKGRRASPKPDEAVFRIKDPKKALAGACTALGLPAYSPRSLRRMFITRALTLGVDVRTIAAWQGHQDGGKLILQTYSHLIQNHSQNMAELLGAG